MTHIIQFSGGKDSTALVLWAKKNLLDFVAVFCDTGWEYEHTYDYIDDIDRIVLAGGLIRLDSEGMVALVTRKRRVPSTHARFCTQELKVKPFLEWLKTIDDERTIYQGIRADESASRREAGKRVWSDDFDAWIERPLFDWTAEQVFAIHREHGISPNILYSKGCSRVGCAPCIMVNHGELRRLSRTMPEVWDNIKALETAAGRSFFKPGYIPERYCTGFDPKSGVVFPTMNDVRFYVTQPDQPDFWFNEPTRCLSVYNLCE
jgi:3'-phosphoadenosine 5'-phosphosulfate sulfotransferase (PAPS reductase)/FAD synthetase